MGGGGFLPSIKSCSKWCWGWVGLWQLFNQFSSLDCLFCTEIETTNVVNIAKMQCWEIHVYTCITNFEPNLELSQLKQLHRHILGYVFGPNMHLLGSLDFDLDIWYKNLSGGPFFTKKMKSGGKNRIPTYQDNLVS